jgi:two-component system response regulator YesN
MSLNNKAYDSYAVQEFLKIGFLNDINIFVDRYIRDINLEMMQMQIYRQYVLMDISFQISRFLEERSIKDTIMEQFADEANFMLYSQSLELTRIYLREILQYTLRIRDEMLDWSYGKITERAKKYINKYYMDKECTLNTVSRYVGLSSSYFSSVFKREEGISYIEFLTAVRMKKAKELLINTEIKVCDLGNKLGYTNKHYFLSVFKKHVVCTPKDYRRSANITIFS